MNILIVGMRFYNYEILIKNELVNQGHNVKIINDVSSFYRFYSRLIPKKIVNKFILEYQKNILKSLNINEYEVVIVLVGRFLTKDFLEILKKKKIKIPVRRF